MVAMRYDALLDFKALRALLQDPNLPEHYRDISLKKIAEIIRRKYQEEQINLFEDIRVLDRREFNYFRLRGPRPKLKRNHVRVAAIMLAADLITFHTVGGVFDFLDDLDLDFLERVLSRNNDVVDLSRSPKGIRWITLARDLDEYSYGDIFTSLLDPSPYYAMSVPLAIIEYDIDASQLHVPTVIDSGFSPYFISKPKGADIESRAWNWRKDEWGPHEFVHNARTKYDNLDIRLIEVDSPPATSYPSILFNGYEFKDSGEIEKHLERLFKGVCAYPRLEPFIKGKTAVLKLTSREFEQFASLLFEVKGYETDITKSTHDEGVDVIAHWDKEKGEGILIEAKHTKRTVGIRVIRELIGARILLDDELSKYMMAVVTTSKFSHQAYKAQERLVHELKLIDYQRITKELNQYSNIGVRKVFEDVIGEKESVNGKINQLRNPRASSGNHID